MTDLAGVAESAVRVCEGGLGIARNHRTHDRQDKIDTRAEYAQPFAENRIDLSVLPDLTDQDLEKLGLVLGDRRKMLRAIANLDNAQPAVASAPAASVQPIAVKIAVPTGERRHVTVMFCDLVDDGHRGEARCRGMARSGWRYLDAASAAVTEMGGKVAKKWAPG